MTETLALPNTSRSADDSAQAPSLSNREATVLVALALVHFAFLHGPIWRHPWSPDASIVWSYVPIPALVGLVLLRGRRLTVTSGFLGTLQVATFKFLISASMLIVMWAATSPSAPIVPSAARPEPALASPSSALVANQPAPLSLVLGGGGAQTLRLSRGDRVRVHSGDQRMHTLQFSGGPNVPIVPGAERTLTFDEAGTFDLGCAVHPHEPQVTVVVATSNRP